MQEVTPSEILSELRNDGRGRHHLAEAHKAVNKLEAKLAEIKNLAHETHEELEKEKA
jgi:hypothetical protein